MSRAAKLGLEPLALNPQFAESHLPTENEVARSQAISLKRIADAAEKSERHLAVLSDWARENWRTAR